MEIVYRKLSELKPNPKNPRKATDGAIARLAASIKENPKFFEARPILLSDRTGELVIIGGERRSEAAALLKMESVPTILMSGLTEAQEDEIMIKDNAHAGVWDEQKLQTWDKPMLVEWGVDEWIIPDSVDENAINRLFEKNDKTEKNSPVYIVITIPKILDRQKEEIKNTIVIALKDYSGIEVK